MVWRRKRRPAGRQQPSLQPHPVRLSPQTRRESSACGESSTDSSFRPPGEEGFLGGAGVSSFVVVVKRVRICYRQITPMRKKWSVFP